MLYLDGTSHNFLLGKPKKAGWYNLWGTEEESWPWLSPGDFHQTVLQTEITFLIDLILKKFITNHRFELGILE